MKKTENTAFPKRYAALVLAACLVPAAAGAGDVLQNGNSAPPTTTKM